MKYTEIQVGDGQSTLLDVKSKPALIRRGTLTMKVKSRDSLISKVEEKPVYIVELAEESYGTSVVSVFSAVQERSGDHVVVQKAYTENITKPSFKGTTFLGKVAQKVHEKSLKPKRVVTTKPPVFLAPVVMGVDTFTQEHGLGFYEREPDKFVMKDGHPSIEYGKNTGVFICLNSIKWDKAYVSAGQLIQDYVADKQLWFNLGGTKPQFKSEVNQ